MDEEDNDDDGVDDFIIFPCEVFEFGCLSLRILNIKGDIFGTTAQAFSYFY